MCKKLTTKQVITKCQKNHPNFDYSNTIYIKSSIPISVTCKIHNYTFFVLYHNFIKYKNGCCPKCSSTNKRYTKQEIIEICNKVHQFKYDYSLIPENPKMTIKYKIICKLHGIFKQTLNKHKSNRGCPYCANENNISRFKKLGKENLWSNEKFIEKSKKIHNNFYSYEHTDYKEMRKLIIINCPIHGKFKQKAKDHITGSGCPICNFSKGELKIKYYINNHNIKLVLQKKFENCFGKNNIKLPFDFYLPDYNTCIEYDGPQHYKPVCFGGISLERANLNFQRTKTNDKIKNEYCLQNNIRLLRIPHWEFKNIDSILEKEIILVKK